jgi:hypothetical protein
VVERLENEEEKFTDDPGDQRYQTQDVLLDRGVITTPYDAPVRTLLDEIREKMLIVNPPFQRKSVWGRDRQSKLIESLLLNIPIPVLYFAEDEDGTRVVVDGHYFRTIRRLAEAGEISGGFDVRSVLYACVLMKEYDDTMRPAGGCSAH